VAGQADLAAAAQRLVGLTLSPTQLQAFERYSAELIAWNQRFNLTAITEPAAIATKHFLDSLTCLLGMGPRVGGRVIDVGTGAGFPGLPLKIVRPQIKLTLVEATGKKAEFCSHIVELLGLEGVEVIHGRAEEVGHQAEHREAYDWALARAVAALPVLVEYLLPFLRRGGRAIAQKGETGPAEAHSAERGLGLVGGRISQVVPVELPGVVETRYLVVMEKVAGTPADYPRRSGVPTKRPLA
jgi:16S rRNA (guanine527-N7)-methyltransferase